MRMTTIDAITEKFATKADLGAAIAVLKAELQADMNAIRGDMSALEARLADKITKQTWALVAAMLGMGTLASSIIAATITVAHYLHW
jgi:hypothetical protein